LILIDYNDKVNKLFFLYFGQILIKNKNGRSLFVLKKTTLFADWFLNSRTASEFIYTANTFCICFTLDSKDYKEICSNYIDSAREFAEKSYLRYKYYKEIDDILACGISGNTYIIKVTRGMKQ
jgi:signal-transduction protein with cAMP-binding, CBS, and nucleotidyltransferase domain